LLIPDAFRECYLSLEKRSLHEIDAFLEGVFPSRRGKDIATNLPCKVCGFILFKAVKALLRQPIGLFGNSCTGFCLNMADVSFWRALKHL